MRNVRVPKHDVTVPISVAAAILGVSDQTVRRWTTDGVLELHSRTEVGRYRRYRLSDVEALAAKRARKAS